MKRKSERIRIENTGKLAKLQSAYRNLRETVKKAVSHLWERVRSVDESESRKSGKAKK